MFLDVSVQIQA